MQLASWRKCDFQVHSCRDPNWTGPRPIGKGESSAPGGAPATEADVEAARVAWADEFVTKCAAKGLQAVALTDHHETVMVPYVRDAIARRVASDPTFDLWLLPGMELTAKGGQQCIVLFDNDVGDDWLRQAQVKLGIVLADLDDKSAKAPKVTQLACTYPDIGDRLDELVPLKGRYIVLPNVSQGGDTVLKDGAHADFLKMACVGGYLDRNQTIDTLGTANRKRLSGTDPTWSKREVYPFPTSDCRSSDRAALGENKTWIKLAAPTAESVRQAFLAHRSRIRIAAPELASVVVSRVIIESSSILQDLDLDLSPELTSVIGGRGSGKSSFLEYLAFGLGRSCFDLERGSYSGSERLVQLIEETLRIKSGKVRLVIRQDNAVFEVVRSADTAYQPQITYPNGVKQTVTVKELRSLFPAVVYGQGELAEMGKLAANKADLADLLPFVNADYKREDDALLTAIEGAKRDVRLAVEKLIQSWLIGAQMRKLRTTRDAVKERVAALEKTLPALSEDNRAKLELFDVGSQFEAKRLQASKHADRIVIDTTTLIAELSDARDLSGPASPETDHVRAAYAELVKTFVDTTKALKTDLESRRATLQSTEGVWDSKFANARKDRDAVLEKLSTHKVATAQIVKLKEDLDKIAEQIGDFEAQAKTFEGAAEALTEKLDALKRAVESRSDRTRAWADEIETLSSAKIVAKVVPAGDVSEIREAVDALSVKTGSQEATRLREVDNAIAEHTVWGLSERLRTDCMAILHWRHLASADGEEAPKANELFRVLGTTPRVRTALTETIDAAKLAAIATAVPKPEIELSYSDRSRQISFEKASEGQRAAALLFMLLEQTGGPLIVDQPEGDLDNSIITDLTDKLHSAKQKRQILFASHNANIVVNGSSELVGHLNVAVDGFRAFDSLGAIDLPPVREVITRTMEGGAKAFRDRQEKYGF